MSGTQDLRTSESTQQHEEEEEEGRELAGEAHSDSNERQPEYWCHQCQREITPMMAPHPICPRCHGDFVEEIDTENDPREFVAEMATSGGGGGGARAGHGEGSTDEMENEFGGAGTYNAEVQNIVQELISHLIGRAPDEAQEPSTQQAQAGAAEPEGAQQGSDSQDPADSDARRRRMRTWTGSVGGTRVSVAFGGMMPQDAGGQSSEAGPNPRPMFIDPEENAPLNIGNLLTSLFGALGGTARQGGGPLFGIPMGNLGDYVWGQGSFDDIVTQLMEQNQNVHAPPPATDAEISQLPTRTIEKGGEDECGICMDDYKPGEVVIELPCKHYFHDECIKHWLVMNGTCPVCRASIAASDQAKGEAGFRAELRPHSELPGAFPANPQASSSAAELGSDRSARPAGPENGSGSGGSGQVPDTSAGPASPPPEPEPEPMD